MKIRESVKELVRLAAQVTPSLAWKNPDEAVRVAWRLVQAGERFALKVEEAEALGLKPEQQEGK